jgi:DNA-binding CsgD family transcriptional regulator
VFLLCEIVSHLCYEKPAGTLYDLLQPHADQFIQNSNSVCYGSTHQALALIAALKGDQIAETHFGRAIEANASLAAPLLVARGRELLGRYLLDCGRRAEARGNLDTARTAYERRAMPRSAARVAALLAEKPAARAVASNEPRLSAREVEVLRLIAAGCSNREIAERLVLSPNTVERHITNLYAKIDARGKADATAYALRHGLAG